MVPRWQAAALVRAVWVCMHFTNVRPARPAFLVHVRTRPRSATGDTTWHDRRCFDERKPVPLYSAAEKSDTAEEVAQLSDMDARVLDELLNDPSFMESLVEQGIQFNQGGGDGDDDSAIGNSSVVVKLPSKAGLAVAGQNATNGGTSFYESVTMQVVEELQDSVRGLFAKVSAAFESAGIYVSNRAKMDVKVVQTVVDYASTQAAAGTSRLLLAATDAASPALLLMGVNTTETQTTLNDSLQLLSMGIVPDSFGVSPKLLTSLKDFDDDDKRLDAAYRRQRRRRSKPLPAKLLGALPSTINKAADLAYEVEQEVKYERAGSRANKLLEPIGLLLPEAKDGSLLLRRKPGRSGEYLLGAPALDEASRTATVAPAQNRDEDGDFVRRTGAARQGASTATARRGPKPAAPNPFDLFNPFRQKAADAQGQTYSSGTAKAKNDYSGIKSSTAAKLATRPLVLAEQLAARVQAADEETRLQSRRLRAVDAVLSSTGPIVAGLDESTKRDMVLVEELRKVTSNVQQMYVLIEMTEAVEAADTQLERIKELSSNVMDLAAALRTYLAAANTRGERLPGIVTKLEEARGTAENLGEVDLDFVSGTLELLQVFDDERVRSQQQEDEVDKRLKIVWQESNERGRHVAGEAHEEALAAACRLWEASIVERTSERGSSIDSIKAELAKIDDPELGVPTPFISEMPVTKSSTMGESEKARVDAAEAIETERFQQQVQLETDTPTRTRKTNGQRKISSEKQVSNPAPAATVGGEVLAESSPFLASPAFTRATSATELPSDTAKEEANDFSAREVDVVDATVFSDAVVVSDSTARPLDETSRIQIRTQLGQASSRWVSDETASEAPDEFSLEVVVDEASAYVDIEFEVEDDMSDPTRVGLKFLDVSALLIEKVLFVGIPTVVSGGALVWERVDNATNGGQGRKGWKLLKRLKQDPSGTVD